MTSGRGVVGADRAWRAVVFSRAAEVAVIAWMAVCVAAFAASVVPAFGGATRVVLRWVLPAGVTAITWLTASSYALTSAAAFSRREVGTGIWMAAWTVALLVVGGAGVYWALGIA